MISVLPGADFEAVSQFETGLAGTMGVRIRDNEGADALARSTSGITEDIASSGIYTVTLVAPVTAGQYTIVWDDGAGNYGIDDLLVVQDALSTVVPSGHDYISLADLKSTADMSDMDFADADLQRAISAASRGIDMACNRRFWNAGSEVRYYTPISPNLVMIDDLCAFTLLESDQNFDGTFEESWALNTEFVLTPNNADLDARPWTRLELFVGWRINKVFPSWSMRSVRVTGSFGWAAVPPEIIDATTIIATKLAKRKREAPFGVVMASLDQGVAARIAKSDPDVNWLLGPFMREYAT